MPSNVLQLLGSAIFPAVVGMAFFGLRRKPDQRSIPPLSNGGLLLFLKTWAVAFVFALIFGQVFSAVGMSESVVSGIGQLVLPAICAYFFVKHTLSK